MKLQVNTAGAWKDVCHFDTARKAEVAKAVSQLAGIVGVGAKWSVLHDNGKREWIGLPLAQTARGAL